jgi:hypothetical protein
VQLRNDRDTYVARLAALKERSLGQGVAAIGGKRRRSVHVLRDALEDVHVRHMVRLPEFWGAALEGFESLNSHSHPFRPVVFDIDGLVSERVQHRVAGDDIWRGGRIRA